MKIDVKKVIKRDGRVVDFDIERIRNAILKAMLSVNKYDEKTLNKVVRYVVRVLNEKYGEEDIPHVEDIQDIVEFALVRYDLYEVAKAYILYRKEREKIRKEKMLLLNKDYLDEVDKVFSLNAIRLLAARYLLKDDKGNVIETPKQMFQRVAMLIVIPDILYDEEVFDKNGNQDVHEYEEFDPTKWEYKLGLGYDPEEGGFKVYWNKYHLSKMKELYDRLNNEKKMKLSWSEFLDKLHKGAFDRYYNNFLEYYNLMVSKKFMPNSPTLFNAGTRLGQLSACFVLAIDDDINSIMKAASDAAKIFKTGGGIGINYSKLRPEGDIVSSTAGVASGPVSFMRIIDTVTDVIKQGGRRRGANMGILEIWHPDIEKFITCKSKPGFLENFNISVLITPDFWQAYEKDEDYNLVNPRDGSVWKTVNARQLFRMIAENAWKTGDPGVLFLDNMNKHNIMKKYLGEIRSTNPCAEEPLYPYESCNLGSINLYALVKEKDGKRIFDWDEFRRVIKIATRFLDNVIDVNTFPIPEIKEQTLSTRKIGLGLMGLADTLFALKIPYNSEDGFWLMSKFAEHLTYYSMETSVELARERGVFPLFDKSAYVDGEMPIEGFYRREEWTLDWEKLNKMILEYGMRNSETTTVAPTGSISMIADTSSGIEPQFALVFEKRVTVGTFFYVDSELEYELKRRGLYSDKLLKKIADNGGSLQDIEEIPEDMKRVFLVAYDIPWWDHVRAQIEISKWISAAVSKTINMPNWVSVEDVEKAYLFAYRLGAKGITIYRDGSKAAQVLVTPSQRQGKYILNIKNRTLDIMKELGIEPPSYAKSQDSSKKVEPILKIPSLVSRGGEGDSQEQYEKCPICESLNIIFSEGCIRCIDCGWSACVAS